MPRTLRISPEMAGVPAAAPLARMGPTPGYDVAAQAFGQLSRTVAHTGGELLRIQAALQAEDAKLDMQTRFNQLKLDFGLREAELRDTIAMPEPGGATATTAPSEVSGPATGPTPPPGDYGIATGIQQASQGGLLATMEHQQQPARLLQPKDYAATFGQEIDKMVEDSARGLKYPGMERHYRAQVAEWVGRQKVEALNRGIKLQHEAITLTDDLAAREEANTAVFGTPAERTAAFQSRLGRIQSFVARGIYSGEKGATLTREFLGNVERGEAARDYRVPERRAIVMDRLVTGQYKHIPPAEQLQMAQTMQDRQDTQARQAEADARREYSEARDFIVRDLFSRAADRQLTKSELDQWAQRWSLNRPEYDAILTEIRKPAESTDAPSDPATLERVITDTHSQYPRMTEKDLIALRGAGKLNLKDFTKAMDRLRETREGLVARGETEGMRRHAQAEQELRAALGIPTIFDKLDPAKEKAWQLALPELRRRSNMYGGKEDPLAVVESIRPRYQKMLGQDAGLSEKQTSELLRYPSATALEAARRAGAISEGEYQSQNELFRQADRLRRDRELREAGEKLQQDANKALGKSAPKAGTPAGGGGKTLGR